MTTALTVVDDVSRALDVLAAATDMRDILRVRNEATVLKTVIQRARLGFDAGLRVAELELRASRRAGELLIELAENGGRRGVGRGRANGAAATFGTTLEDLGVERWESKRWQAAARIPDDKLDAYIERQREQRKRLTVSGFVGYSSESAEWYTPDVVKDATIAVLGRVDLDPCAETVTRGQRHNIPARRHYTAADDGLAKPWNGSVYMNSPYGDEIPLWVAKLVTEHAEGRTTRAITLVPARTDTAWFRLLRDDPVCFVAGRLVFKSRDGAGQSAPFPSAIFGLGVPRKLFLRVFGELGDVWERAA